MTITQILMAAYKKSEVTPPVDTYPDARLIALFNGANGSTSFVDSSPYNVLLTSNGGAALSTVAPLTGVSSLLLDSADKYVSAEIPAFDFGRTKQWCFEWTCRQESFETAFSYFSVNGGTGQLYCTMYYDIVYIGDGMVYNTIAIPFSYLNLSTGIKYKMAVSYDGTTYRFFINGTMIASSMQQLEGSGGTLAIGNRLGGYEGNLNGMIDDFVVTMNSAKRTENYIPS